MKAVIFDMDGVVSDTQRIHSAVESALLAEHGIRITPEEMSRRFSGVRLSVIFSTLIAEQHVAGLDVDALVEEKWRRMAQRKADIVAIPGVEEFLKRLRSEGYLTAIASGSRHEYIDIVMDALGFTGYFDVRVSGEEVAHGKPAPDVFLLAARKLGVDPCDCVVIEDGISGMQAAKAAGMRCIGLVSDDGEYPADVLVKSLCSIDGVILSARRAPQDVPPL